MLEANNPKLIVGILCRNEEWSIGMVSKDATRSWWSFWIV